MKNRTYKLFFLGLGTVIVASTSYALISPGTTNTDLTVAIQSPNVIKAEPTPVVIDKPAISEPLIEKAPDPALTTLEHKIKQGESLSTIFSELNLSKVDLHHIVHANVLGTQFASIMPGKKLIAKTNAEGLLEQLIYKKNAIDTLIATRKNDTFDIEVVSKPVERKVSSTQQTILTSLFVDGKKAGLSDKLIMQLADIFAWDIDFALSLRKGDQFTVVYDNLYVDDKLFDAGHIISAEFVNQGHTYRAVRFEDEHGNANYYTPEGKSMRKAFLRTPVDFARISSRFNLKRKHPVLNRIRAHKGVDYAAKTGTPIKTTGDGKIRFRGKKHGYGNVVIVQHGQKYSTLYAHMSGFKKGQKVGSFVKQGQVIGYVGSTGLATGPHVHYEFRINGIHRNPLTVKLPHSLPIKKSLLAEFKRQTEPLIAQLNKAKASTLLAQNK